MQLYPAIMPPWTQVYQRFWTIRQRRVTALLRSGIRLRRLRRTHRGAKAPSPVGNLPSERYLTRDLLLPATLDSFIVSASEKKAIAFFQNSQLFAPLCIPKKSRTACR